VTQEASSAREVAKPSIQAARAAMQGVPFAKMTGSGNDFVVFNARDVSRELVTQPEVIAAICNRNNGIGGDGLVLLEAEADSPVGGAPIRLQYFNRDGTLGELCGNATLCSTRLAVATGLANAETVLLDTDSGRVSARLRDGTPEIDLAPVVEVRPTLPGIKLAPGETRAGFALVGVPHVVLLADDVSAIDVAGRGRPIRQHATLQPAGANVNWVAPLGDGRWAYRTYERGVEDETLACGTGAIACAILLTQWGLASGAVDLVTRSGRPLIVSFREVANSAQQGVTGGSAWHPSLRGEGRVVFRGTIGSLG
jgi:diaminopimelate epimerase